MSDWKYDSDTQRAAMAEEVTDQNCGEKLKLIRSLAAVTRRELAAILGTSESTIARLETEKTLPTADFMNRLRALAVIGFHKFSAMSAGEKEAISETLGAAGGATAGIAASIAAVSASGTVAGLSVTGITSGLAALGGSMLGGLVVVAAIPVAVGIGGYGLVKGIKAIVEANNLNCQDVDGKWEITMKDVTPAK